MPKASVSANTRAELVRAMTDCLNTSGIDRLFIPFDLEDRVLPAGANKESRATQLVRYVHGDRGGAGIRELIRLFVREVPQHKRDVASFVDLLDALRADGLAVVENSVVPIDDDDVPAAAELGVTMSMLETLGWTAELGYYQQAVNAFERGDFHACNGQLRTFWEALLATMTTHVGAKPGKSLNGHVEILLNKRAVERSEKSLLNAISEMFNTNGSHPGATTEDEARFRLLLTAATARWMLIRVTASATVE